MAHDAPIARFAMILNTFNIRAITQRPANVTEANIRYLYAEIFFAGVMAAITSTYNSLLAVRFGAPNWLIGVLIAAPALIAVALSIPSAHFLERKKDRVGWLLGSLAFMRLGYLVVPALPLFVQGQTAAMLIVGWIILLSVPTAMFTNGFNAILAELIPPQRRAFVFSRRAIIYSLTITLTLPITGAWLNAVPFPMNYQVVYMVGVILVMGSQYFLGRVVIPKSDLPTRSTANQPVTAVRAPLTPPIARMVFNSLVYQLGLQISGPLFVIYYVNTLHVSDGLISLNTAAGTFGVVFGLFLWEAALRKRSYGWALRTASLGTWIFPFTVAFSTNFSLIIAANFVVNLLHPGVDLSSINVMFNLSPPQLRNMYMSYYTMGISVSAFVAPLSAVPLAGWVGIPAVMLLSAALRLTGGALFQVNRVPETT
ncbi:MAG: MFS transporter [Aggregatilineales bacterium]